LYDYLENSIESIKGQRQLAIFLVIVFISAIIIIEMNRWALFPESLSRFLPSKHLAAVELIFTLSLLFELLSLVFTLAHSVSISLGKQFEILSLVLIRDIFKEFSHFDEPLHWEQISQSLDAILASAIGALLIFVILGFYYRALKHRPITKDEKDKVSFIIAKKMIALLLFFSFCAVLIYYFILYLQTGEAGEPFQAFYTVLIFSDVLIMLISMQYGSTYLVVFRNSGFAVATVLIRLAFITPVVVGAFLGVGSALFVLGLVVAYNYFSPSVNEAGAPTRMTG